MYDGYPLVDVKTIRESLGMTQEELAFYAGFGKNSVSAWEKGEKEPKGTALLLLNILKRHPEILKELL